MFLYSKLIYHNKENLERYEPNKSGRGDRAALTYDRRFTVVVVVIVGFYDTLLTSQVISISFYTERENLTNFAQRL